MATYAPVVIARNTKHALPVPGADAYAVGDGPWFLSDNNTNNGANRGISIPAGVPVRITSGSAKYGFAIFPTIITMTDV